MTNTNMSNNNDGYMLSMKIPYRTVNLFDLAVALSENKRD